MTVTTTTYRRLVNLGNYENVTFEMSAAVAPDEDPAAATRALVEQVHTAIRAELADHTDHWRWPDLFPPDKPAAEPPA